MADSRAQSKTLAEKSYHPSGYKTSPALARARLPFRSRNILTGALVVAFGAGVFAYSIRAVKQEDFGDLEDLLPPPSQRQTLKTIEEELLEKRGGRSSPLPPPAALPAGMSGTAFPPALGVEGERRGVLGNTSRTSDASVPVGAGMDSGRKFERTASSSPFQVSLPHTPSPTPSPSNSSASTLSPTSTELASSYPGYSPSDLETFNLFRVPFLPALGGGRGTGAGVDVDRLGSVWDRRDTRVDDGRRRV